MHLDTEDTAVHTTENHDFGFVTDADVVLLHDEVARDDRSRTDQDQYEHDTHRDLDPFAAFPTLPRSLIRVWVGRPWFYSLWGGLGQCLCACRGGVGLRRFDFGTVPGGEIGRAHAELQSRFDLVCRLLLEKKKHKKNKNGLLFLQKRQQVKKIHLKNTLTPAYTPEYLDKEQRNKRNNNTQQSRYDRT